MQRQTTLRALLFFLACIAVMFGGSAVSGALGGTLGRGLQPIFTVALIAAAVLAMSWAVLRGEGRSLAVLGLERTRARATDVARGVALGIAMHVAIALALGALGLVRWEPNPNANAAFAATIIVYFALSASGEELVFRGYAFERFAVGAGVARAMFWMAFLFGLYHIVDLNVAAPRITTGEAAVWGILGPAAGALLFGFAYLRSGGLPLPVGLHFGGDVAQWLLLTPRESNPGGPWLPVPTGDINPWLPRAFYLLALAAAAAVVNRVGIRRGAVVPASQIR